MSAPETTRMTTATTGATSGWQRLSPRIIWVDLVISVLALLPALVAILVFDVEAGAGQLWPLIGLAAFGVLGALADIVRWAVTRFRVSPRHVELKTGLFVRKHRSVQRDRIRSVDIEAKLRHRVARLRVVAIGAGQQSAAGESAFSLDALGREDALELQQRLLNDAPVAVTAEDPAQAAAGEAPRRVLARFEPSWFIYNMFSIWAYVLALGVLWGGLWALSTVGIDLAGFVMQLADWEAIGVPATVAIAVVAVGAFGAVGLGVNYVIENWGFELARVPSRDGTMLRTRKGLFTTREVNRDENRLRGVAITEPVLWRWMGVSDTHVITTGLDAWSFADPAAVLPRGPVSRARAVAGEVLGGDGGEDGGDDGGENPMTLRLRKHPVRALRRRLVWATVTALAVLTVGVLLESALELAWLDWTLVFGTTAGAWVFGLLLAVAGYRALGHRLTDDYLITRSGALNRTTAVLQRSAVSTIMIRESLFQRRLKLRTVAAMTAAGDGRYDAVDVDARDSLDLARQAAPGLLEPFLEPAARASGRRA
ncbi:MAG: PH domain-containing protein [Micrococcaceae bacterium]